MVKNNKLFKVLAIVLAIICIVSITGIVNGADLPIDPQSGITATDPGHGASGKITDLSGNILWIIQAVGIAAGVIIIAYMGIKYITSAPDGKAEIKKQAYVYILGAAFLILAPTIANVVFNTVNNP